MRVEYPVPSAPSSGRSYLDRRRFSATSPLALLGASLFFAACSDGGSSGGGVTEEPTNPLNFQQGEPGEWVTASWNLAEGSAGYLQRPNHLEASEAVSEWERLTYWTLASPGAKFSPGTAINNLVQSWDGASLLLGAPDRYPGDARELDAVADLTSLAASPVAVSRDGTRVASIEGLQVVLWDGPSRERLGALRGHRAEVLCLDFNPTGTRLVSGDRRGVVILHDVQTQVELLRLEGFEAYVHAVSFSPDGTRIAAVSGDESVRLWDSRGLNERHEGMERERDLRARLRPVLEGWLAETGDPSRTLERAQADPRFGPSSSEATLRVLLELAESGG